MNYIPKLRITKDGFHIGGGRGGTLEFASPRGGILKIYGNVETD